MSCRSHPATSAATTFARLNCSLTDVQTLSAFHALRAQAPRDAIAPDQEQWRQWLATEARCIEGHPNLTEARRRSLHKRLSAAERHTPPDGRTWIALQRIRGYTQQQSRALDAHYAVLAEKLGTTVAAVRNQAAQFMSEVDTGRSAPPPEGYTNTYIRKLRGDSLPVDRQTAHALLKLERLADQTRRADIDTDGRRVSRHPVQSTAIREVGYDPDDGRLEVVFHSNPDRVYAYRNVPADIYEQMRTGSAGQTWQRRVRNHREYLYSTQRAADEDAYRVRCAECGQFKSRRGGHSCSSADTETAFRGVQAYPEDAARQTHTDPVTAMQVTLPPTSWLATEVLHGPITASIRHQPSTFDDPGTHDRLNYTLSGELGFDHDPTDGITIDSSGARCSCYTYLSTGRCPHLDSYLDSVRRAVNPEQASVEDAARLHRDIEAALESDWTRSRKYAAQIAQNHQASPISYSDSPAAFDAAVASATERRAAGQAPVPYFTDDATDGSLSRESGRGFGVELEFDFPDDMSYLERSEALAAIGADMHAAGLTSSPTQSEYHEAATTGYTDEHQGGWSFEQDSTVAGEIVSPIMYDEPETWANLATVCDIVRRHGGQATPTAGSHVHVSATWFRADVQRHTELLRLANQHEDTLYRLASNPSTVDGEHRPVGYCSPNPEVPLSGYRNLDDAAIANSGHDMAVNLESVTGYDTDHVEFRHWDASLDPAVIQTQIKISAALMSAAVAATDEPRQSQHRPREPLGAHWTRNSQTIAGDQRVLTAEEQHADSATTRSLIDTLFHRPEDKEQVAALYAVTRWQRRSPSRGGQVAANRSAA